MESRPKIKLTLSPTDKKLELFGKILLALMWGSSIYIFLKLPVIIPTHFNASGRVDGHGNKITFLILPVFATLIYWGLTVLNKYPQVFNYLTEITEENAQRQYSIATKMLRFMKLAILIIFSLVILFTYLTIIGVTNGLGIWFLPLTFALFLIPTIISIRKSLKQ
jgi:hypothetical protein